MKLLHKKAKRPGLSLSQMVAIWMTVICLAVFASGVQTVVAIKQLQIPVRSGGGITISLPDSGVGALVNPGETGVDSGRIIRSMAMMFFIICLTAGLGFAAIYYQTVIPLRKIISALGSLQDGNLAVTLDSGGCREMEQIDSLLNDIASNYQETLLLVWSHCAKSADYCGHLSESIGKMSDEDRILTTEIAAIQSRIQEIQNVIGGFEFFDVSMEEDKLIGG
jgi:hypothetical protein